MDFLELHGLPARPPPAASHGFQPWPQPRFTAAVGAGPMGSRMDLILALAVLQWLTLVQQGVDGGRAWAAQDPSSSHFASLSLSSLFCNCHHSKGLNLGPESAGASFIQQTVIMAAKAVSCTHQAPVSGLSITASFHHPHVLRCRWPSGI